jgi:hypothetical protein
MKLIKNEYNSTKWFHTYYKRSKKSINEGLCVTKLSKKYYLFDEIVGFELSKNEKSYYI